MCIHFNKINIIYLGSALSTSFENNLLIDKLKKSLLFSKKECVFRLENLTLFT